MGHIFLPPLPGLCRPLTFRFIGFTHRSLVAEYLCVLASLDSPEVPARRDHPSATLADRLFIPIG